MDLVDRPQNYKGLYRILHLLQGSHLDNFLLKTLKLGGVAFYSLAFQLKYFDFQSNQYKKLTPAFLQWAMSSPLRQENLILRLPSLKSTLSRHENRAFRNPKTRGT